MSRDVAHRHSVPRDSPDSYHESRISVFGEYTPIEILPLSASLHIIRLARLQTETLPEFGPIRAFIRFLIVTKD